MSSVIATPTGSVIDVCAGVGGLSMGLALADPGVRVTHVAETEPSAVTVLERHHPGAVQLGDVKTVDWASLPSPRWLCAGYPCQPFSAAGKKLGTADPRHLWPWIARGIGILRPSMVLLENVRGHVGRGLSEVLAELVELGYGGAWGVYRASDVGAPHQRARVFVFAVFGLAHLGFTRHDGTPQFDGAGALLPTPEAKLATSGPDYARMSRPGSGGHDLTTAVHLMPTPTARDGKGRTVAGREGSPGLPSAALEIPQSDRFGRYAGAVARWERIVRATAPAPIKTNRTGGRSLNPAFPEWMMGWPAGHVTDTLTTQHESLRAIGNGVVPLQAAYAVRTLSAFALTLARASQLPSTPQTVGVTS